MQADPGGNGAAQPSLLAAGQLRGDSTSFVEQHRIRAYEVGPDQCATIVTVANLLQVCLCAPCLRSLSGCRHLGCVCDKERHEEQGRHPSMSSSSVRICSKLLAYCVSDAALHTRAVKGRSCCTASAQTLLLRLLSGGGRQQRRGAVGAHGGGLRHRPHHGGQQPHLRGHAHPDPDGLLPQVVCNPCNTLIIA